MIERDNSGQYWVDCPKKMADSGIPIKVQLGSCLECDSMCCGKEFLWDIFIQKEVTLSDPRLNMERYDSMKGGSQKYCIQKSQLFKDCYAKRRFCTFNEICPHKPYAGTVRLLRQRRVEMYAIVTKNKEMIIVDTKDLKQFPVSQIKEAYLISHAVRISTELIPYNDDGKEITDTIKTFVTKYGGNIILPDGSETQLKNWFNNAPVNSSAFIVTGKMKAARKIELVNLKKFIEDNPEGVSLFMPEEQPEKKVPEKRIRRTREQMDAERKIVSKIRANDTKPEPEVKKKRTRRTKAEMIAWRKEQDRKFRGY